MPPVSQLDRLLRSMAPVLNPGVYVYVSLPPGSGLDWADVVAYVREAEGPSFIVAASTAAELGLETGFLCRWLTLTVHSDLQAVGLTAAFATALAEQGISCNVVAGTHHDHLFVPVDQGERALQALQALQSRTTATQ